MNILSAYRLPSWQLIKNDTVILRADCNVPSQEGIILDDARLHALIPTLTQIVKTGAHIIILTHWGRPKKYTNALSTQKLVEWFNAHGIPMAFCNAEINRGTAPIVMLENIRFLNEAQADTLVENLARLGTHFVHDGFSVMHRNDIFNTQLPLKFLHEKRSLGINAYQEITRVETFLNHMQKPYLGIFGGAKLKSKIDALENLSSQLNTMALLPAACFPLLKTEGIQIGASYDDGTSAERIAHFKKVLSDNSCRLITPPDLLVTQNPTYAPPYRVVATNGLQSHDIGITYGPQTIALLHDTIDTAHAIILNGFSGFLDQPNSLKPFGHILSQIAQTKPNSTLIAGGDTYAAVTKLGLAGRFPYYALAGGATLAYCADKKLPGLEPLL